MTNWSEVPEWISAGGRVSRRDRIVLQHLALVKALAVRIARTLPTAADLHDLYQAGVLGLLDAAETYDTSKNGAFGSYAKHRIKGTILDSLRQLDWAPRSIGHPRRLTPVARDSAVGLRRGPADRETGEWMEVSRNRRRAAFPRLKTGSAGGSAHRQREDHFTPEVAASPESQPDQICERNELRQTLTRAIQRLPNRYRSVLVLSYDHDMTNKQISGLLGVSEGRISQIRRKALLKMSAELQLGGFTPHRHVPLGPARVRSAGAGMSPCQPC